MVSKMSLSPSLAYCSSNAKNSLFVEFRVYMRPHTWQEFSNRMMHDLETLGIYVPSRHWPTRPTWKKPHFSTSRKQMGRDTGPPTLPCHEPAVVQARKAPLSTWRIALVIIRESISSFLFLIYFLHPLSYRARMKNTLLHMRAYTVTLFKNPCLLRRERVQERGETKRKTRTACMEGIPDCWYIVITYVASFVYTNDPRLIPHEQYRGQR